MYASQVLYGGGWTNSRTRRRALLSRFVKGKDSVFGEVADSWFRFEEQGRGSLHLHLLLWLKKEPEDEQSTDTDSSQDGEEARDDLEQR